MNYGVVLCTSKEHGETLLRDAAERGVFPSDSKVFLFVGASSPQVGLPPESLPQELLSQDPEERADSWVIVTDDTTLDAFPAFKTFVEAARELPGAQTQRFVDHDSSSPSSLQGGPHPKS